MHSRLQSKVVALDAKVDTLMLPSIFSQLPDGTGTLRKQSLLRIECEFTLSSIRNELFVGTSLLQCQPPPHRLLQAWNKLGTPQGMACVRALTVHKISDLRSSLGGTSCAMVVVLICRIVAKKRGCR